MDLFGFGSGSIIVLLLLVLILFGPGRSPKQPGLQASTSHALKKMSSEFTEAVSKEVGFDEDAKGTGSELKPAGQSAEIRQKSDASGPFHVQGQERPESISSATGPKDGADRTAEAAASERKE